MNYLIGADPELFLINTQNKLISSIGKFGGTKRVPKSIGQDCYVQEDNVAVEFNIPPAASLNAFLASINYSLAKLQERAKELNLDLHMVASANFDSDQLKDPKAKIFGCDPDLNAWTLLQNRPPQCQDKSLRSAGGHVHVGCRHHAPFDIARALDLFLGVPSIKLDPNTTRRQLYGKAGAFRHKPYGAEYRTLSNFWLKTDQLKTWVYHQTMAALNFLDLGNFLTPEDGVEIQACINDSNHDIMKGLIQRYGLESSL